MVPAALALDDQDWLSPGWPELEALARRTSRALDPPPEQDRTTQLIAAVCRFERGDTDRALEAIARLLRANADWVEGHVTMAQLLSQQGSREQFEHFLGQAVLHARGELAVAITCLRLLSEAEFHETVSALLPQVRSWAGNHLFFTLLEAITASEMEDMGRAEALFARAAKQGGVLSLPHVRHLIRSGDASKAATIAEAFLRDQPHNQGAWGLVATAWRMMRDSRHEWLVDRPGLVRAIDLDITPEALVRLAGTLRKLHVARSHPFDQSLRGGTQTAGRLFRRDDPAIRDIREALTLAVRRYLDTLPPHVPGHPLLGRPRGRFHVSDSWSVRLLDGGFHLSHFHPQGTLSSAFYVALPALGTSIDQAGWLTIGEPPASLRTGLPPIEMIEPRLGRLALFPSFLWHGTRPFARGERMTVAFDTVLDD